MKLITQIILFLNLFFLYSTQKNRQNHLLIEYLSGERQKSLFSPRHIFNVFFSDISLYRQNAKSNSFILEYQLRSVKILIRYYNLSHRNLKQKNMSFL